MAFDNKINILGEIPPSLSYIIDWASPNDRTEIMKIMNQQKRQTMNLRLYSNARLLVLKDIEQSGKVVGWTGFAVEPKFPYPELFSSFLYPEYRTYLLGLTMNHARCQYLIEKGFSMAWARMTESNTSLLEYRKNSGMWHILQDSELDATWVSNCTLCELYKRECQKQIYLKVNIDKIVEHATQRVGPLPSAQFPKGVQLKIGRFRKIRRPPQTMEEALNGYQAFWIAA